MENFDMEYLIDTAAEGDIPHLVRMRHRQHGICSKMLLDLLNRLRAKGIKHITLNYVVNNTEAERTWRALGFTPIITSCVAKI